MLCSRGRGRRGDVPESQELAPLALVSVRLARLGDARAVSVGHALAGPWRPDDRDTVRADEHHQAVEAGPMTRRSPLSRPLTQLGAGTQSVQDVNYGTLDAPGSTQASGADTDGSKSVRRSQSVYGGFSSELEMILANRLAIAGLPVPEYQFKFCSTRRWRADMAYPAAMLLIEADGGTWSGGRHVRGKGFESDCEKTSTAAAMGYRVIRLTRTMIEDGRAVALIRQALTGSTGDGLEREGNR